MPQFEIAPVAGPADFVRARSAEEAVRARVGAGAAVALAEAEPGSGWQAVQVDGADWGQVRPRDRMRFRRD